MHPGAGGFPCGVEAAETGAAGEVGADSAHQIVRGGTDGDKVAGEVESIRGEECADAGEAFMKVDLVHVAHVEIDEAGCARFAPCLHGR